MASQMDVQKGPFKQKNEEETVNFIISLHLKQQIGKAFKFTRLILDLIRILTVELELACNRGSCRKVHLHLKRFPRISLDCKLVPVQP